MSRYFCYILLLLGLAGCSTQSLDNFMMSQPGEWASHNQNSVVFDAINSEWQHAKTSRVSDIRVDQFVPFGETVYRWDKRITTTYTKARSKMTAKKYYAHIIKGDFLEQCYSRRAKIMILQTSKHSLLYEAHMIDCGKLRDQMVIGRVMRAPHSVSTILYALRGESLDPEQKEAMVNLVMNAKIIRD